MCKIFFAFFLFLCTASFNSNAQLTEDFSDGNFTTSPAWTGNITDFIVNDQFQLQSNNSTVNSVFYLSTPNTLAIKTEWTFWVQMAFNPSSANYIDAYLIASASDLSLNTTSGYFVRMGGTDDEISLFRKNSSGTITKIIEGAKHVLNTSNNVMRVKVTRDENDQWTLWRDVTGTGNQFVAEGSTVDNTYQNTAFFGFLVKQSTASFFQKHFFDNIVIKNYVPDLTAPSIVSAVATSGKSVDILFDEPLDKSSSERIENYFASNGLGMPASASLDVQNPALVHLLFSQQFINGINYSLIIEGVKDLAGNAQSNGSVNFSYYTPQRYDVIISEVFPDPSPQVGLPLLKFLELKNRSARPINLQGWKLKDGNSTATLPFYQLQPDSFVIVTATNSATAYMNYGSTLGVANFPALNITGTTVVLQSAEGKTMHAMQYDLSFYRNELKKEGGWTLEMIDTNNPCSGISNWAVSAHPSGGTPGKRNSVAGINKDETAPHLINAFAETETKILLNFNESLDSLLAVNQAHYTLDNGLTIGRIEALPPFYNHVAIHLNNPILAGKIYSVTVKNLTDCSGNVIASKNTAKFGMADPAGERDVIINEILFNPPPMGVDYVEIYNRSNKNIDLAQIYLANRNSSGAASSIQQVSREGRLIFPGEFALLTSDPETVKSQFITTNPDAFIKMNSLPTYANTSGNVLVLNGQGNVIDEVNYSDKWHFKLLKNAQGVSLERINYDGPSVASNFHSASASNGYGTPGFKNSQYLEEAEVKGEITVVPEVFSPDHDGVDDLVTIEYRFPKAGYVANITIFDGSGRPVRYLQKNSLSGVKGYFRWDGLDDKNRRLPQGVYIIYTEIFNLEGKKKIFKNSVVLARRSG
ncbi:MAG: lamin tail domain-containing protein [Ginsengibacter sp.]